MDNLITYTCVSLAAIMFAFVVAVEVFGTEQVGEVIYNLIK